MPLHSPEKPARHRTAHRSFAWLAVRLIFASTVGTTLAVTAAAMLDDDAPGGRAAAVTLLAAIAVGAAANVLLVPWRRLRAADEQPRRIAALAAALQRALRNHEPLPRSALLTDRRDAVGAISAAVEQLMSRVITERVSGSSLRRRVNQHVRRETTRLTARLRSEALTDPLTGLGNRRRLQTRLAELAGAGPQRSTRVTIAALDLDRFKLINDTLGHGVGDACLEFLGSLLHDALRDRDEAIRLGGDEFIIIIVDADDQAVQTMVDRLRAMFRQMPWSHEGVPRPTLSCGFASAESGEALDPADLMRRADAAMYRAKREARRGRKAPGRRGEAA